MWDLEVGLAGQCWANKAVLMSQARWWFGLYPGVWTHNVSLPGRTPGDGWFCLPPKPCTAPMPQVEPPSRVP